MAATDCAIGASAALAMRSGKRRFDVAARPIERVHALPIVDARLREADARAGNRSSACQRASVIVSRPSCCARRRRRRSRTRFILRMTVGEQLVAHLRIRLA